GAVGRPAGGGAVSGPGFAAVAGRGMPAPVVSAPAVRPAPGFAGAGVVRSPGAFGRGPVSGFVQSPVGPFIGNHFGTPFQTFAGRRGVWPATVISPVNFGFGFPGFGWGFPFSPLSPYFVPSPYFPAPLTEPTFIPMPVAPADVVSHNDTFDP